MHRNRSWNYFKQHKILWFLYNRALTWWPPPAPSRRSCSILLITINQWYRSRTSVFVSLPNGISIQAVNIKMHHVEQIELQAQCLNVLFCIGFYCLHKTWLLNKSSKFWYYCTSRQCSIILFSTYNFLLSCPFFVIATFSRRHNYLIISSRCYFYQ